MSVCGHLASLERELLDAGYAESFRGRPWSQNCREWVYFDCVFDREALRRRHALDDCVRDHEHLGTHDGAEAGFVCSVHDDAVVGVHPAAQSEATPDYR